jgi:hypothetical protein
MKTMLKTFYAKPLAIYLALALLAITTFVGPAEAMFVPAAAQEHSADAAASDARSADLARVRLSLESKIIQQKLMDYGLSPEDTLARVNKLSNEQLHQLATHTDALQAGGHGGHLLLILLLVILILILVKAPGQSDMADNNDNINNTEVNT